MERQLNWIRNGHTVSGPLKQYIFEHYRCYYDLGLYNWDDILKHIKKGGID